MKTKKKQELPDIFIRGRKLTLGVKLVGTFAFTFYLLYFLLLTVFGIFYRSVYDPTYSEETLFKILLTISQERGVGNATPSPEASNCISATGLYCKYPTT